jgi:uncharacterized RDD family membrane protein YckC
MLPRRPAGFWIRLVALVVDGLVFALVQLSLGLLAARIWGVEAEREAALQGAVAAFTLLFTAAYAIVLHSLAGQTIGKLVVGVQVVGDDGEPPRPGAALLRYLGYFASLFTFGIGFLMAGLRADKRGLHDLLAGTRVERLRATPRRRTTSPLERRTPPLMSSSAQ